jgi:hypothetical protein
LISELLARPVCLVETIDDSVLAGGTPTVAGLAQVAVGRGGPDQPDREVGVGLPLAQMGQGQPDLDGGIDH